MPRILYTMTLNDTSKLGFILYSPINENIIAILKVILDLFVCILDCLLKYFNDFIYIYNFN